MTPTDDQLKIAVEAVFAQFGDPLIRDVIERHPAVDTAVRADAEAAVGAILDHIETKVTMIRARNMPPDFSAGVRWTRAVVLEILRGER